MFLTGPGVVREALGEEISAADLGGHRVHDHNGVCHLVEHDELQRALRVRELLSYLPSCGRWFVAGARCASVRRSTIPGSVVPSEPRRAYDVRDALPRHRRRRFAARAVPALGPERRHDVRPDRGPAGRYRGQPAPLPGRRARRRELGEGGSVRVFLRLVRSAADRGGRHARVHARLQAGAGGRDPARGVAGAGVRRGPRAEAHGGPAQVLRRRVHHDELARPRRRPGAGVAGGRARDHERPRGGRSRSSPRAARGR